PVTDFAGARGRENRLDARLDEGLRADHLDLHFLVELHDDRGAAVLPDDLLLAPVTADAAQRDPGDAGLEQRRLDFGEPLGPDDGGDEFHGLKLADLGKGVKRIVQFLHGSAHSRPYTHLACRRVVRIILRIVRSLRYSVAYQPIRVWARLPPPELGLEVEFQGERVVVLRVAGAEQQCDAAFARRLEQDRPGIGLGVELGPVALLELRPARRIVVEP